MIVINGREIDTSCPWMGTCWSEGGCVTFGECPPTLLDTLRRSAEMEHECELLTDGHHTDPDLAAVCHLPHKKVL